MLFPQPDTIWRRNICGVAEQTEICWYLHLSQQLGRPSSLRSARNVPPQFSWVLGTTLSLLMAPPKNRHTQVKSSWPSVTSFQQCLLLPLNSTGNFHKQDGWTVNYCQPVIFLLRNKKKITLLWWFILLFNATFSQPYRILNNFQHMCRFVLNFYKEICPILKCYYRSVWKREHESRQKQRYVARCQVA